MLWFFQFNFELLCEKNENKQIEAVIGPFLKRVWSNTGSGAGTLARAVASTNKEPWFESRHWHFLLDKFGFIINYVEKNQ